MSERPSAKGRRRPRLEPRTLGPSCRTAPTGARERKADRPHTRTVSVLRSYPDCGGGRPAFRASAGGDSAALGERLWRATGPRAGACTKSATRPGHKEVQPNP